MNFFASKSAAKRYAKGRPNVQSAAIEAFNQFANVDKSFTKCLDVGCGTGLSSVAVADICESVIGIDASEGMLSHAAKHPKIKYQKANAENLPFEKNNFDLITVGLAMHWLDQPAFLKEAERVLIPNGWLVIYNNKFTHRMKEVPEFTDWFEKSYLERFPNPPRKNKLKFDISLASEGFNHIGTREFTNEITMTCEQFVAYLNSQSNIIACVEQGEEKIEDVENWLLSSTKKFFNENNKGVFLFRGDIWIFRKKSD